MTYNTRVCRNDPFFVVDRILVRPWVSRTETIRQADCLYSDGFQIGQLFQRGQIQFIAVWKGFHKLPVQALIDAWVVDDMEGRCGQRKGRSLDAAANDNLGFVCKSLLCLVRVGQLGCEDFVKDGLLGVV